MKDKNIKTLIFNKQKVQIVFVEQKADIETVKEILSQAYISFATKPEKIDKSS